MKRKQGGRRPRGWVAIAAVVVVAAALSSRLEGGDPAQVPPAVTPEAAASERGEAPAAGHREAPAPDGRAAAEALAGGDGAAGSPSPAAETGSFGDTSTAVREAPGDTPATDNGGPGDTPADDEWAVPGQTVRATVTRVVDGDTVDVQIDGRTERVRLIGVDTPEVHGTAEPYGAEASAFTKERLTGQEVSLELDAEARDRYGRLLAYVWVGDELFNATLVREGYAQVMTVPPNVKYADRFVALQQQAREAGAGLWGLPDAGSGTAAAAGGSGGPDGSGALLPVNGDCGGLIKGNINASGEKIYHVPGGQFYDRTYAEACFATRADAEAAGYRASRR